MTLHGTARLLEQHGHNLPLHRYPIDSNTNGEPRFSLCSPPDSATPAMALHTVSA
jgi:hypothetical protein